MSNVAIVGSGPAGLYLADALLRQSPDIRIDIFERLPTPFGLILSGVAPDHPGTRVVTRQFEKLLKKPGVHWHGNVTIGRDLTLAELQAVYPAVVLAVGASYDRQLGIEGENLTGVYGSGSFTRWYNGHPDAVSLDPQIGKNVAIIGNGNVALDIARILARDPDSLETTDIAPRALKILKHSRPEKITIVGRGPIEVAKFSPKELAELTALREVRTTIKSATPWVSDDKNQTVVRNMDTLSATGENADASVQVDFLFGFSAQKIIGKDKAEQIELVPTDTQSPPHRLPIDTLITAIGFLSGELKHILKGDFSDQQWPDGKIADGLFVSGWARRGPSGTIATNRIEARELATTILNSICSTPPLPAEPIGALLRQRDITFVEFETVA